MQARNNLKLGAGVFEVTTDTVQGWGAWLDDEAGIRELMKMKSRELDDEKRFALVVSPEQLPQYVMLNDVSWQAVEKFRGSPLTLELPKNPNFKHWYYDKRKVLGMRMPSTETLLAMSKRPFVLTSANERGGVPEPNGGAPTTIARVRDDGTFEVFRQGEIRF